MCTISVHAGARLRLLRLLQRSTAPDARHNVNARNHFTMLPEPMMATFAASFSMAESSARAVRMAARRARRRSVVTQR